LNLDNLGSGTLGLSRLALLPRHRTYQTRRGRLGVSVLSEPGAAPCPRTDRGSPAAESLNRYPALKATRSDPVQLHRSPGPARRGPIGEAVPHHQRKPHSRRLQDRISLNPSFHPNPNTIPLPHRRGRPACPPVPQLPLPLPVPTTTLLRSRTPF